jgi:hypothetical protein
VPAGPASVNPPKVLLTTEHQQGPAADLGDPLPLRLLNALRHAIRVRHYSIRPEEAGVERARRFVRFHGCSRSREWVIQKWAAGLHQATRPRPQLCPVPR